MIKNVGEKIQGAAILLFTLGIIASLVIGGSVFARAGDGGDMLMGIAVLIGGVVLSWFGMLVFCGFGQLVDNSDVIRKKLEETTDDKNEVVTEEVRL